METAGLRHEGGVGKACLGRDQGRGHQLLAETQLAHVRQSELLLGGVVCPWWIGWVGEVISE